MARRRCVQRVSPLDPPTRPVATLPRLRAADLRLTRRGVLDLLHEDAVTSALADLGRPAAEARWTRSAVRGRGEMRQAGSWYSGRLRRTAKVGSYPKVRMSRSPRLNRTVPHTVA
jgi:hypothetical protein